jgi:hypothetical protein
MAIDSSFLKTMRRFAPALAVTVLLAAVAAADSGNKVHWARSTDGIRGAKASPRSSNPGRRVTKDVSRP